jgi:glycosyltransferase involved in cell wall biosynthesis
MNYPASKTASILCVGMGWFPEVPGGLNRYVYELTQQLAIDGDQIELCGTGLPSLANDSLTLTNLAAPQSSLPLRLWRARREFPRRALLQPHAINLHFALYSLPILQQLPQDIPITFTFHGPWAQEGQREGQHKASIWFKQWVEHSVYNRCDRFIVLSKAFGTILHQSFGVPWSRIHVIPGGVNTTRFQPNLSQQAARTQLGWHLDRPILFSPRRLVHRMGLDKLLAAMVQVKQQVPDVWLAIAGKGSLQASLQRQIQDLGLENHVKLLGFLPDEQLPIAYQAANLTVVPSQSLEGFGLILLESLASGTPALCTPVGGMPEVLTGLTPDLITDSIEAEAIRDRLVDILSNTLPLPSRSTCRDYACQHFDWQRISQQVREVLLS